LSRQSLFQATADAALIRTKIAHFGFMDTRIKDYDSKKNLHLQNIFSG
jgi:hypothetical protein